MISHAAFEYKAAGLYLLTDQTKTQMEAQWSMANEGRGEAGPKESLSITFTATRPCRATFLKI